jgi:putative membrane protein
MRVACVVFATAFAACNGRPIDGSGGAGGAFASASGATMEASTTGASSGSTTVALDDSMIADAAWRANAGEVEEAQAVLPRLEDPRVVAFANGMIADDTSADQGLKHILSERRITRAPSAVSAMVVMMTLTDIRELAQTANANLDPTYLAMEVTDHAAVLVLLDDFLLRDVRDPALKEFLVAMRSTEATHLEQATKLASKAGRATAAH